MNKKILLVTLISLSIFMAGCANKQAKPVTAKVSTNKQIPANTSKPKDTSAATTQNKTITKDDAFNIVSKMVGPLPKGYHLDYDHTQTVDSKEYYVIHLYEVVVDDEQTGVSHTVTYYWYYVDIITGTVYKLDVPNNTLIKVAEKDSKTIQEQQVSYKQYTNARFGFSIQYPSSFVTKTTPDNNDGIILAAPDGSAELTISGNNNVLNETALSSYNNLLKSHSNASYKSQKGNWSVVSWIDGDKIVYEKEVVGKGSINTFIIKYPLAQKSSYDSIISQLNSTFKTPSIDTSH